MERKKRLNRTTDIQRVRQRGKSFPHPLLVLIVLPETDQTECQIGVIATKAVGGAVERNHAKRVLRAAVDEVIDLIRPNNKILILARKPIIKAETSEITTALLQLIRKAGIYNQPVLSK
ncbi:MAG: ribonuclease P protein component [Flexilinea sp.]